ncbi:uncharacterized protein L969DRAFT_77888 [Mixia osmundae IAM 14324]|uniref:RING-type domain-containing protein n=1 Tax=Mixia osmundae (strain CBS 9802 / IAM 14324 / JCM 22182 / KY 12970) TaxID=764103 RepID=G7E4R9_MIXOS|nr:uncharacterized protein L969DRAFT_77888 [Mixia osmundae IAM 14324]KEI37650.1 hypothetical protein L969DRAFT_77888 [Mixia osmundae IAM 14324]GAA97829.1 hypothetical protein E5Q_04508 [Mixia osmundae IAM 14324]
MTSSIYYKFRSQKDASTITFDGTGISVFDIKKDIIAANKMGGKASDFDFAIFNPETDEEYRHDSTIVPRATTVLARRTPASRRGQGNAQKYIVDESTLHAAATTVSAPSLPFQAKGPMSMRFDNAAATVPAGDDEESRLAAMFAQSGQQWEQQSSQLSNMRGPRPFAPIGSKPGAAPPRPGFVHGIQRGPPPGDYTCHRCGQRGHWIQDCATNSDPNFENKPKLRRTTGIPRSFLQTVEAPTEGAAAGVMVTADGGFVIARPDAASWAQRKTGRKNLTPADVQNLEPTDPDLSCPICAKLLKDAVIVPCCSTSFCETCIRPYLEKNSMICPECESKVKGLDALKPDEDRRTRVKEYIAEMVEQSRDDNAPGAKTEDGKEEEGEVKAEDQLAEEAKPEDCTSEDQKPKVESPSNEAEAGIAPAEAAAPAVNGLSGMMDPMWIQTQMMQCLMMMNNPALPPPMRMQAGFQLQQFQAMAVAAGFAQPLPQQDQTRGQKRGAQDDRNGPTSRPRYLD